MLYHNSAHKLFMVSFHYSKIQIHNSFRALQCLTQHVASLSIPRPHSHFSSHTGLLVIPRTCHSHGYLRAFGLTTPLLKYSSFNICMDHIRSFYGHYSILSVSKVWSPCLSNPFYPALLFPHNFNTFSHIIYLYVFL